MKIHRPIRLGFFICMLSLISCNDYLDVKSNSALVTPNSIESLQSLLDASHQMNFTISSYAEASADDYFLEPATYQSISIIDKQVYTWQNFDQIWNNDWAIAYLAVYNSNLAINKISEIERNASNAMEWDNVKGSALFFRASQFLNLVWTYANGFNESTADREHGIVLRLTDDPTVRSTRANLADTYQRILDDLFEAEKYLPLKSRHPMRPSGHAVFALLARVYLSMGKFDEAYLYAGRALDINNELLNFNNPSEVNLAGSVPFRRFNKETIYYAQLTNTQPLLHPNFGLIDTTLYDSYHQDDLRKRAYFLSRPNGYYSFKGSYTASTDRFAGLANDEMYLVKAECAIRLGRLEEGLELLNELLASRWITGSFVPFEVASDKEALQMILSERRKSLAMRGLRWSDIKRLNLLSANISVKRIVNGNEWEIHPNDKRFALPIPLDVVKAAGIPQNEYQ